MGDNKNHPVKLMAELMADMAIRLEETEKQLEEEKKWFDRWRESEELRKEAEAKLQHLNEKLALFIEKQQKEEASSEKV